MRGTALLGGMLALVACGGNVVVDQGTSGTGGGLATGVVCIDAGPQGLADGYKACTTDTDCTTASIIDCCKMYVEGVATAELSAYNAYVNACSKYAPCPCPMSSPVIITDDGKSTTSGSAQVACQAGLCSSFLP